MKKIIAVIAAMVAVLILIGFLVLLNIGTLIERAVQHYGPKYTNTAVTVADVDVALFAGSAALQDFKIGNPETFDAPEAVVIGSALVDINEKTLTRDPLVIESIRVNDPQIFYELSGRTDNIRTILENVRQAAGAEKASRKPETEQKAARKIIIEQFVISGGVVTLAATGLKDRPIRAEIPPIRLENIGGSGGTVPAEASAIILDRIYQVIRSAQVRNALDRELRKLGMSLDDFRRDAKRPVERLRKEAGEAVREKAKEMFGK